MDLEEELQNNAKKIKRDLLINFKPTDCKHCYGSSAGVMGIHYSCNCEESEMYCSYPLVFCPQDCGFYEKGQEE